MVDFAEITIIVVILNVIIFIALRLYCYLI